MRSLPKTGVKEHPKYYLPHMKYSLTLLVTVRRIFPIISYLPKPTSFSFSYPHLSLSFSLPYHNLGIVTIKFLLYFFSCHSIKIMLQYFHLLSYMIFIMYKNSKDSIFLHPLGFPKHNNYFFNQLYFILLIKGGISHL